MTNFSKIFDTPINLIKEAEAGENSIYIKRDDLLPFSLGGNKVRIAVEYIKDMRKNNCDAILMYGDKRSNLCRVLSNICKSEEIPCAMVATSENEMEKEAFNEKIINSFSVKVIKCEKNKVAEGIDEGMTYLKNLGCRPYYIFGDRTGKGNEKTAANAYIKAFEEIVSWQERYNTEFDYIFVPCGNAGTAGGIAVGNYKNGSRAKVVAISISSRNYERAYEALSEAAAEYEQAMDSLVLKTEYNCGGYGLFDERIEKTISHMMENNGIPMDPTYSAKAYRGMLDYIAENNIRDKKILFIHTGGISLYFDYLSNKEKG